MDELGALHEFSTAGYMRAHASPSVRADERTRTPSLLITSDNSLVAGFARGCKCRIPKPVSFLRLAPTEIRPGNYVFYDAMQVGLAIVPLDHCALRVLATVVSVARRYL